MRVTFDGISSCPTWYLGSHSARDKASCEQSADYHVDIPRNSIVGERLPDPAAQCLETNVGEGDGSGDMFCMHCEGNEFLVSGVVRVVQRYG